MIRPCILSVIVANHNRGQYLEECLDSVLNQTCKELEIVVYDDGSSDNSPAIIRNYEQRHPRVIRGICGHDNRGVAYARHQAILAARGEYLTTLDSDDFYFGNDKLDREMDLVRSQLRGKGRDVIAFSNTVMVNALGQFLQRMGNEENIRQGDVLEAFLTRTGFIPRDFIMKKTCYLNAGCYDTTLRIREDWDLKIRLARHYSFLYSGVDGTAYRRHANGLSSFSASSIGEWEKWLRIVFNKNISLVAPQRQAEIAGCFEAFLALRGRDFIAEGAASKDPS